MFLAGLFLAAFVRSLASPVPVTVPGNAIPSPICVVAAAITAAQCDPTRTRTIFDILYSCIGVILLCTYISIHHNMPDQGDSWAAVVWSKLRTTLYALIAPEMVMTWAIRQWIMARRIARDNEDRRWTETHGFFIQMGGLVRCVTKDENTTYKVLHAPHDPQDKASWEDIKIPRIPEKEIQDHGKGDLLAKAIVVIQTTWFVVQCIARKAQGLALTEIELVTLAFAALNVITYALWWNKPLNVGYPIYFKEDGERVDGPLAEIDKAAGEGQVKELKGAWYSTMWRSMRDCVGEACQRVRESWRESFQKHGLAAVIVAPLSAVFAPLADMIGEQGRTSATSVHPFYAAGMDNEDQELALFCSSAIGIVFGAIHLTGWNFQFSTTTELWLWRAASLVLTIVPLFLAVGIALSWKYHYGDVFGLTLFLGPPIYFAVRMILLFLAFFTLRDLPESAYQNVRWTEFIPHI